MECFSFYRLKLFYTAENEDGALVKTKEEVLLSSSCYADAETMAISLLEDYGKFGTTSYEVIKTKINQILCDAASDIFYHENNLFHGLIEYYFDDQEDTNEIGLYMVRVSFLETQDNGKIKQTPENIFVPAKSPTEAVGKVKDHLKESICDYIIRDVKFDKAKSVFVLPNKKKSSNKEE